jgi:branched-chain amino acid transport system substrate-binding protein
VRRSGRGYDPDDVKTRAPFWVVGSDVSLDNDKDSARVRTRQDSEGPIGIILSLSERFGSLGRDTRQGFELAVMADKSGETLKIEARDVGADTAAASAAVRELAGGIGASVIVGPLLTEAATAAAETAREIDVPLVALSKSEGFRTGGNIFRLGATSSSQIDALLTVAVGGYGVSRLAVVAPQSASGTEYVQALRRKAASLGCTVVFQGTYPSPDDVTMATLAQQVESSGADAVLLPDTIEASSRFLTAVSPSGRKKIRPLGTALWDSAIKIANSQAVFAGALFVTPFFPQSNRSVVRQFVESYRGRYQTTPNFLAAQGFDVGTLVVSALRKARREGTTFKEALAHLPPYDGTTGYITVVPPGDIRRAMYVVEVTRDTFIEKSGVAGAIESAVSSNYTYRGNQQVDSRTDEIVRESDAKVDSGY